jgi:glycosyltransferase involved in cell wall biosynthesis
MSSSSISQIVKDVRLHNKPTLALVMMVKNENKRILVSLESVKNYVECLVILDTGSEDNTINIIREFAKKYNKPLHLIERTFPHPFSFCVSRNVVLDFADDKADYLLLLDCNDELKGGEDLRKFVDSYNGGSTAFHICQEWWNGSSLDKYYNIRLVKSKHQWRYRGNIHEYIMSPEAENQIENTKLNPEEKKDPIVSRVFGFSLYQDRTQDDDKSFKRFSRDEEIFHKEYEDFISIYEKNKNTQPDTRMLFYYGQTAMCMGKNEKAYKLYKERTEQEGFAEEKYHAYYRCGETSKSLGHDWEETMSWYIKAYEYSSKVFDSPRAEPLYRLAEYYRDRCWDLCFMYLRRCCEVVYPENAILFVDRRIYDYCRWNLMGIVAYYVKQNEIGKISCLRAIEKESHDIDVSNLAFYVPDINDREKLIKMVKNKENIIEKDLLICEEKESIKETLQNKIKLLKDKRSKK